MTISAITSVSTARMNDDERALLEAAAGRGQTNSSDFVRRKALEAAEFEMLDPRRAMIVRMIDIRRALGIDDLGEFSVQSVHPEA